MAKLKFKNPKTGLWEEAGGTTYTAGDGISISPSNVISAINKADVTKAGDNTFTGRNTFTGDTEFDNSVSVMGADLLISGEPVGLDTPHGVKMFCSSPEGETWNLSLYADTDKSYIKSFYNNGAGVQKAQDISFSGSKLADIGTPTADTDAATKKYVDEHKGTLLFAQSVDELNASGDKTKIYLLPDGYLYAWAESTSQETVTISTPVDATTENPYKDGYRLGSSGDTFENDANGYTVTPLIDLSPYAGKTIRLKLQGLEYFTAETKIGG